MECNFTKISLYTLPLERLGPNYLSMPEVCASQPASYCPRAWIIGIWHPLKMASATEKQIAKAL